MTGELWSETFGSASGAPVSAGDFVFIPAGQTILIDENTVPLGGLFVEGTLAFDETAGDLELQSAYILVTGDFLVGCKDVGGTIHEFPNKVIITLIRPELYGATGISPDGGINWGTEASAAFSTGPIYNAAVDRGLIITAGGELLIYGKDRGVSWTSLNTTAAIGVSQLDLLDDPTGGWVTGDELIIASTDFEYADDRSPRYLGGHSAGYVQGEVVTLSSSPGSSLVDISPSLTFSHFGEDISGPAGAGMRSIPERAEVGLLTRSVVIQGDFSQIGTNNNSGNDHYGHVVLIDDNPSDSDVPYCEVQWAEFRNLGIQGKLARYPFHWHELGDAFATGPKPYLKHSSIHDCFNRFVTVHSTKHVIVEDNVGYNTEGSGFYLETPPPDLDTVQNVQIRNNLGLAVNRLPADVINLGNQAFIFAIDRNEPGVFYHAHPNNQIEGNHAAGAFGHGFYLLTPKGLMYTHDSSESSYFRNNVAHSNGQHGFYHNARPRWTYNELAVDDLPAASGLVAYKNRRYGLWWRAKGRVHLEDIKLADNKSGFYPASEGTQNPGYLYFPPGGSAADALTVYFTIDNFTIFGETTNVGQPANNAEIAAGRSLPQTYTHFERPGSVSFDAPWDTVNGIEAYDGLLDMTNIEIAYFTDIQDLPDPFTGALYFRPTGGITQTEYESSYAEDPRNRVDLWNVDSGPGGTVDHPAYFRTPAPGASMVWNTVIHDPNGTLGYGTDMLLSYQDDFFIANSANSVSYATDQLYASPNADVDFAQVEVDDLFSNGGFTPTELSVLIVDAGGAVQELTDLIPTGGSIPGSKVWAFNIVMGIQDGNPATEQTGIYYLEFPVGTPSSNFPTEYDITVKFAESVLLETVICVPFVGAGFFQARMNGTLLNPVSDYNGDLVIDERDLLDPGAFFDEYYLDSSADRIYVKTTTVLTSAGGTAAIEGTKNVIHID